MSQFDKIKDELKSVPKTWLVTGVAGFIGSNLLERLLLLEQKVTGLDNLSTGYGRNLQDVKEQVGDEAWKRFRFIEGDIRNLEDCRKACAGVDYVLHQAALGSVPRSIDDPIGTNQSNIDGFINMLVAARDADVKRFVYASSSSIYGDHPGLPKREESIGRALSPYAVTKHVNELYAGVFSLAYGMECIGLRYFNVFGSRQDPNGAYAAVVPRWIGELLKGMPGTINGDGETSRDFCYIENVVQANFLAATTKQPEALNQAYNIANGGRTTLNELYAVIRDSLAEYDAGIAALKPNYGSFRPGDVKHSQADISRATDRLGYVPTYEIGQGMRQTVSWYMKKKSASK